MDEENAAHTHNEILFNCKKCEILPFMAMWMELEILLLSESSTERQTWHDLTHI